MNSEIELKSKSKSVVKGVSLPSDLAELAQKKIAGDAELDFSKYVRRLIRADLASEQQKAQVPA